MPTDLKTPSPGEVAEGHVPDWMDASFFQKALRQGCRNSSIHITECKVWGALRRGENYVSIVYRSEAKEKGGKTFHLIVKCLPSNEARQKISKEASLFRKEIDLYGNVLPTYEKLFKNLDISFPWPKHYYSDRKNSSDYLVMGDLKAEGFVMRERMKGLDRYHLEVVMSALGRYHACSYSMKVRDPDWFKKNIVELFPETLFVDSCKEMCNVFLKTAYESAAGVVRTWGGKRYEVLADKIEKLFESAFEELKNLIVPVEPGALLAHGDLWTNNMLFSYSSPKEAENGFGKPLEVKLLDFQMSRYSSPATDLLYLMVTSTATKTRREHWDYLIEHTYLKSFWNTLETLGHQNDVPEGVFTIEWLRKEMKRLQTFAFQSCVSAAPVIMAEATEAPDMDALKEEDLTAGAESPFGEMAKGKVFQERFKDLLDEFEENGYFD